MKRRDFVKYVGAAAALTVISSIPNPFGDSYRYLPDTFYKFNKGDALPAALFPQCKNVEGIMRAGRKLKIRNNTQGVLNHLTEIVALEPGGEANIVFSGKASHLYFTGILSRYSENVMREHRRRGYV